MSQDRKNLESWEEKTLSPFAARRSEGMNTRQFPEDQHEYRTAFQRDRDRITPLSVFRRLKHKRQVFLTHGGDRYRTLEVRQLSRTMTRVLALNEDLAEDGLRMANRDIR